MKRPWRVLTVLTLLLAAPGGWTLKLGPAPAAALTADDVVAGLQAQYEKAATLVADFRQVTRMKVASRDRQARGQVMFKKPGRMRWDYVAPDPQVLVSDGDRLLMYFEKSRQMIVSSAREALESDVTYSFFAGKGDLSRDFVAAPSDEDPGGQDQYAVVLTPKAPHPQLERLHVWVAKTDYRIQRLRIEDHFGGSTDLYFENLEVNRPLGDDLFVFTPPPETEVIEQR
ncbi:MAG: outer membrane lipoprotein carrier protein LolA [Thermodesulfobacteriota bacterium]